MAALNWGKLAVHPKSMASLASRLKQEGDCLLWQGFVDKNGGMYLTRHNKRRPVALEVSLFLGVFIPFRSHQVCGNIRCVTPEHREACDTPLLKSQISAEQRKVIVAMLDAGMSYTAIGKAMGISSTTVSRLAKQYRNWKELRSIESSPVQT